MKLPRKNLGAGLGLYHMHLLNPLLEKIPEGLSWGEVGFEFLLRMGRGAESKLVECYEEIGEKIPLTLHSVSLGIGSTDPIDKKVLKHIKQLHQKIGFEFISDHIAWQTVNGARNFNLLPVPRTEAALKHVVGRIKCIQDFLGERIAVENFAASEQLDLKEMDEALFLNRVAEEADCLLLLDLTNVHISCINRGQEPKKLLSELSHERIYQMHLANFDDVSGILIDTHRGAIPDSVYELLRWYIQNFPAVSGNVEWDMKVPTAARMFKEVQKLSQIIENSKGELKGRAA